MIARTHRAAATTAVALGCILVAACSSKGKNSGFSDDESAAPDAAVSEGAPPGAPQSGRDPGTFGGSDGRSSPPCTNLCPRQKYCGAGRTTSLSGTVLDPAGKRPLYNVVVYVPNAAVAPITNGTTCDRCGEVRGEP